MRVTLNVNGAPHVVDLWEGASLLQVLREELHMWGSKNACEQGECGSCSVLLDGALVCSCLVLAAGCEGSPVVTVEGLADDPISRVVEKELVEAGGVQCGFCTPGFVVAMTDLLRRFPDAGESELKTALAGNLCRCTGYVRILEAWRRARVQLA
ncbi:MAG TPA: (2Fe-2S)-binding protein [Candidatus Nitrosotalea sp.]|nr:(2Fe-2S)-binding protein [Candidatus Nitrosotalea sp.]